MGNAQFYPPPDSKKDGTTLIELHITKLRDAHDVVGQFIGSDEQNDVYTPVTLRPSSSRDTCCLIPCCFVSIPAGFSAIVEKFGAQVDGDEPDGTWSPGFHWLGPWHQVGRLVSKQLIVFDTPVRDMRTKDRILVNIDVMIVFEIIRAKEFVYNISPEKFDDLLRFTQEEAIRQMASETEVANVYDLHGAHTSHIVEDLCEKFERYGVKVHHFTVKGVRLPNEMADQFEDKTLYDPRTIMEDMKQKSERLIMGNREEKTRLDDECKNTVRAAEEQAEITKSKGVKETSAVIAETAKELSELEAAKELDVRQVKVEGELETQKILSEIAMAEREVKAKTSADCAKIRAEAEAYTKQKVTSGTIEVERSKAVGKKALGEAEGVASASFAAKREFEAEKERLKILEEMVTNQNVQIATTQENTVNLNQENALVSQVTQQGLEALRARLAEATATSLQKLSVPEAKPSQQEMM